MTFDEAGATIAVRAKEAGTVRAYAWSGMFGMVPVWQSSCEGDELGFSTCVLPDDAARAALAQDGSLVISWESASGGVNAWHYPVVAG